MSRSSDERFSVVRKRLESCGWVLTRIHGSHHIFTRPGKAPISIPVHGGKVKAIYVRKLQKTVEEQAQERSSE